MEKSGYPDARQASYIPTLDGLRACAALAVLVFHARMPLAQGGWLGVDIFFVLSGFLLGRTFLSSQHSYRHYLTRRLWRIMPPMLAVVVAVVAIQPTALRDGILALTALSPWSFADTPRNSPLLHTWSVGVELLAYALLPLILRVIHHPVRGLALLAALSLLYRFVAGLILGLDPAYYNPIGRMDGILLGAAVAHVRRPDWAVPALAQPLLIALLLIALATPGRVLPALLTAAPATMAITCLLVLTLAAGGGSWLSHPVLIWLGQRSYGLYLWHYPIVIVVRYVMPWPLALAVTLIPSLILADLTYRLIERPVATHMRQLRRVRSSSL